MISVFPSRAVAVVHVEETDLAHQVFRLGRRITLPLRNTSRSNRRFHARFTCYWLSVILVSMVYISPALERILATIARLDISPRPTMRHLQALVAVFFSSSALATSIGLGYHTIGDHVEGKPTGKMEIINGINTYVSLPQSGHYNHKEAILMLTDVFGLPLINNKLLV